MNNRFQVLIGLAAVIMVGLLTPVHAAAQQTSVQATGTKAPWTPPRTPWGDPEVQGLYTSEYRTPFQHPKDLGNKTVLTPAEVQEMARQVRAASDAAVAARLR